MGNPVYSAAGNYNVSVSVAANAGSSFVSNKTSFSVTSAPVAVSSLAGAYAAVTGNGSPVLASISQNGDQLTLNGSAATTATLIVSPSQFIAGGVVNYLPQLIANGVVIASSSNNSITFTSGPLAGRDLDQTRSAAQLHESKRRPRADHPGRNVADIPG